MAHKEKDNKAHGSSLSKTTGTPGHKNPTKERGPFGSNNGTVQKRTENEFKKANEKAKKND